MNIQILDSWSNVRNVSINLLNTYYLSSSLLFTYLASFIDLFSVFINLAVFYRTIQQSFIDLPTRSLTTTSPSETTMHPLITSLSHQPLVEDNYCDTNCKLHCKLLFFSHTGYRVVGSICYNENDEHAKNYYFIFHAFSPVLDTLFPPNANLKSVKRRLQLSHSDNYEDWDCTRAAHIDSGFATCVLALSCLARGC